MKVKTLKKDTNFIGLCLGFAVLLAFTLKAGAQSERLYIDWLKSSDQEELYLRHTGSMPINSYQEAFQYQIRIKDPVYSEINPDEALRLKGKVFDNSIKIKSDIQIARKEAWLSYEFETVRKNPNNGKLERLISFIPEIYQNGSSERATKSANQGRSYAPSSVLANGNWFKVRVSQTGLHKITYDDIVAMGFDNPLDIRIYGNGGKQLPFDSGEPKTDDLAENPVFINMGDDGVFNSGDFILFYARGPVSWKYSGSDGMFVHQLNQYSDYAYYFLTNQFGSGKRVGQAAQINEEANIEVGSYDDFRFREKDSVNLIKSGRQWCWTHFSLDLDHSYSFEFPNRVNGAPVKMIANMLSRSTRSSSDSRFHFIVDEKLVNSQIMPGVNTNNYEALFASQRRVESVFTPAGNNFRLDIRYERHNPAGEGWLDYIILNTRSNLRFNGNPFSFRDTESLGSGNISRFNIQSTTNNIAVWDITDFENIKSMAVSGSGGSYSFRAASETLREYLVFNPGSSDFPSPVTEGEEGLGMIENQNLHAEAAPDMVIVVHDDLLDYASELAAFHQENDGLTSLIVSPGEIFNEFSSGAPDATAIRDFMKMFYDRAGDNLKLKYLLLFGDGSYDNKNITKEFPTCLPTFQSAESLYPTSSYVTDDFFGLLDDGENLEPGLLDIGIGRFPVKSSYEASIMVDKIKHYKDQVTYGDWRNLICFIGDDEDGNGHMEDANFLADKVAQYYPSFNIDKIFLDAYQQVTVPQGERYPEVNRAINDRIKKGALIMNYLGHGSERGLAHEDILTTSDIQSWDNYDKLPLVITATCEFSRFDDHELTSAGEWIILNPDGGGIGLYTTTRLVYSSPNFRLNKVLYDYIFNQKSDGSRYRFGDIMRLTKNAVGTELNKLNFTLLSDPALTLNFPENRVEMTAINGQPIGEYQDTLKALSHATVEGYVADLQGNKMDNFNGIVVPSVYDKEVTLTNLANDGGPIMEFKVQENILFRGKVSVDNGDFRFSFIVPKDIAYNVGQGRFSFYATDGSSDASGVASSVLIGGSADSIFSDNSGPEVKMFMNDTSFVYGGLTNENPVFLARLSDQYGINTVGNGIGHDVTAVLDNNNQSVLVLNDYYESDLDNYKSGTIRYPLQDLEPGTHTMKLKVWDILNNSTESELQFEVVGSAKLELKNILNYPNPFTTHTDFYFEHNQANSVLDTQIQIFTVGGRLVKSFSFLSADNTQIENGSFRVGPISWDGLDDFGDRIGRGTYIYRVRIRTAEDGRMQEGFQKLVILR